jgi:hypothetical protein
VYEVQFTPELYQSLDSLLICPCIHILWRGAIVLGFGLFCGSCPYICLREVQNLSSANGLVSTSGVEL